MNKLHSVMMVFGTRPEAIKLAPVYHEAKSRSDRIRLICCTTGQHRELLDQMLNLFRITPDYDLKILKADQSLFHTTTRVLEGMREVLEKESPDLVLVQGDTTTAFAGALAAFYMKIPVAHVEAGLRSYDKFQPFPEEANRTFVSHISDLNFCPTERAAQNLRKEQVPESKIFVTGNTVIDALLLTVKSLQEGRHKLESYPDLGGKRIILVTGHRRENFDGGLANLSSALVDIADHFSDVEVLYFIHPNPNVRRQVEGILKGHSRIRVLAPPDYLNFVHLMTQSYLIITDSGGIQEEAPSLRKPVLVARNLTERPEAVECGAAALVGTDRAKIFEKAKELLENDAKYKSMIVERNPFGDGHAAERIMDHIEAFFKSGNI
jgi:UDP-N-acetylglucosamine 2-epimerase (non-hydrolysing)